MPDLNCLPRISAMKPLFNSPPHSISGGCWPIKLKWHEREVNVHFRIPHCPSFNFHLLEYTKIVFIYFSEILCWLEAWLTGSLYFAGDAAYRFNDISFMKYAKVFKFAISQCLEQKEPICALVCKGELFHTSVRISNKPYLLWPYFGFCGSRKLPSCCWTPSGQTKLACGLHLLKMEVKLQSEEKQWKCNLISN